MTGKHPELIRLGYRVNKSIHNFQISNKTYNETVKKMSENVDRTNLHHVSLLVSLAEIIAKDIDEALFFINKMEMVFYQICDKTLPKKRKGIFKTNVKEDFKQFLPPDDLVKGF
jgi:hypothetical protein